MKKKNILLWWQEMHFTVNVVLCVHACFCICLFVCLLVCFFYAFANSIHFKSMEDAPSVLMKMHWIRRAHTHTHHLLLIIYLGWENSSNIICSQNGTARMLQFQFLSKKINCYYISNALNMTPGNTVLYCHSLLSKVSVTVGLWDTLDSFDPFNIIKENKLQINLIIWS